MAAVKAELSALKSRVADQDQKIEELRKQLEGKGSSAPAHSGGQKRPASSPDWTPEPKRRRSEELDKILEPFWPERADAREKLTERQQAFFGYMMGQLKIKDRRNLEMNAAAVLNEGVSRGVWEEDWTPAGIKTTFKQYLVEKIRNHVKKNSCLRDAVDGRIQEEVLRAKESQEKWAREGRVMNFSQVRKLVREDPSCDCLAEYFHSKGFLIQEGHDSAASQESEILALAEEDMAEVSNHLSQHKGVPAKSKTDFRSFCLATMMWVHHLGPASIKEFKVQEWNDRVPEEDGVTVTLSKGAIELSKKEEHWLDCYFVHIRPEYLKAQTPERDDRDRFFLGASGVPLSNPTADVQRLRQKQVL
ncbi:uncharacterized protein [Sinocyclocheilus grahami]|uniref:uncharacterized protein n=1 Tax=Sinocyclocheilus grahami TaxID=75366 RepID=UPI0007AD270A|nr:PREDICTED: uncharacterized protein LOC107566776 [Sinocyclocheilus grahami]